MARFTDDNSLDWNVHVSVCEVRAMQQELDVNVLTILDDGAALLQRLYKDVVLLADCLWICCRDQAQQRGQTQDDFGKMLAGASLERAAKAFFESLSDFFQRPQSREALKGLVAKAERMADLMMMKAVEEIDKIDPESIVEQLIRSYSNSPELSESIPGLTHLGS